MGDMVPALRAMNISIEMAWALARRMVKAETMILSTWVGQVSESKTSGEVSTLQLEILPAAE